MQQKISIEANQINEGYQISERYHLGELQGEYYVAYTSADARRYRFVMFFIIIAILFLFAFLAGLIFIISNLFQYHATFLPLIYLPMFWNILFLIYNLSQRRKWGNRPIIGPRSRHLRVYVYQDGLVKLTNRSCDVVRWSQLFKINYVPPQPVNQKNPYTAIPGASITLMLHGGQKLTFSGALLNIDELAEQINARIKIVPATRH